MGWLQSTQCHPHPVPLTTLLTSWPGQATVVQGEAVVTGPKRAALQGEPEVPDAVEGPAPAIQHEGSGLLRDGELSEAQALWAMAGSLGGGGGDVRGGRQGLDPAHEGRISLPLHPAPDPPGFGGPR